MSTFKVSFMLMTVFLLSPSAHAHSNWCNPANPPDTYDFFPGTKNYLAGPVSAYPYRTPNGSGVEDFERYSNGQLIEDSTTQAAQTHLEVTSGRLESRYTGSGSSVYRRGYTSSPIFRILAQDGVRDSERVRWTDQTVEARFNVKAWEASSDPFVGVHLFARYRTENDLYAASLRRDGTVVIKRKRCDVYTTLATGSLPMTTTTWYKLKFSVIGSKLTLWVNDVQVLQAVDSKIGSGTAGIRTDSAEVYLDDFRVY